MRLTEKGRMIKSILNGDYWDLQISLKIEEVRDDDSRGPNARFKIFNADELKK